MTEDKTSSTGFATAHDGTDIYFEVHGRGKKSLLLGPGTALVRAPKGVDPELAPMFLSDKESYIRFLGDEYRLVFFEYPGEPKMYTLSPATVARDYLAVADAAQADTFAYAGFSWGTVSGLQLALRTDRLKALCCGGFPTLDGPYGDMLKITKTMYKGSCSLYGNPMEHLPENARQFVTYYEGLRSFDDRAVQEQLTMPRLSWIGACDQPELDGERLSHLGRIVQENQSELEQLGWDVVIVPDKSHLDGCVADVAVPIVSKWLREVY